MNVAWILISRVVVLLDYNAALGKRAKTSQKEYSGTTLSIFFHNQ